MKNPEDWLVGVAATLSIGVSGAAEMLDNLLGTMLAESALLRLCENLLPSPPLLLLRINSNRGEVVFVGVGGVFTMTGVPCSEALGGVPGGVPVSMETARALDWRATRSVCAGLWSGVSFMALFEETSDSIADDSWAGSGTAMLRPSLNSVEC